MSSVNLFKRGAYLFGLSVFLLNALAAPALALGSDSDGDGMEDTWETAYGFDPADPSDASYDEDGDSLSNLDEYNEGTDPTNPDTDGDLRYDGAEVSAGTDPLVYENYDLTVSNMVISSAGTAGEYTVSVDFANLGNLSVDPATSGSLPAFVNGVALQTYSWSTLSSANQAFLAAGGSNTLSPFGANVTLVDGDFVQVCVDYGDIVFETDETNNCVSTTFEDGLLPDLVVDSVTYSDADQSVNIVVENIGVDDVYSDDYPEVNFYYDFYNSDLSASTAMNFVLDVYGTDYRSIEGSTTINTGSLGTPPTCTLYTLTVADGYAYSTESDETNNEMRATLDLCSPFSVYAGADQAIGFGYAFTLHDTYVDGAASLTSATIDWGDGSAVETLTETVDGSLIYLGGSHTYSAPETYEIEVCANDGSEELCDIMELSVVGSSSADDGSSSSSSSGSSTGSGSSDTTSGTGGGGDFGSSSDDDESTEEGSDEEVDLSGEEDQEITLTEEDADCSAMAFADISEEDSFYSAVCELWAADIIHGKTADSFDADDVIRRDEAAKIFTRWFGYVTEAYGETPAAEADRFVDVDSTDPLAYYIEVAAEEDIMDYDVDSVEGEDGEVVDEAYFMPHDAITALEIADAWESMMDDNAAGEELDAQGYEADDTMTRGAFVEFLSGLLN